MIKIENIAGEEFNFFIDEEKRLNIKIECKGELLAGVMVSSEEVNSLSKFMDDAKNKVSTNF